MKIDLLSIDCANLQEQKHFYTRKFNFKLLEEDDDSFCLQIGESRLRFVENKLRKAYYHFAINIPYPAIEQAVSFLRKQVELLLFEKNPIIEFDSWKARSVYFHDPAGNVVELIGRQKFNTDEVDDFHEDHLLNISEVGLPVFEVSSTAKTLCKIEGIEKFDSNGSTFCALGDHRGLLIIVDEAEKTWFPTKEQARAFPLRAELTIGDKRYELISTEFEFGIQDL